MPEMTTSVRWTAEESKRAALLAFSGLTTVNVGRRLLRDRRIGRGEALAGIASLIFLVLEFGRRTKTEAAPPDAAGPEPPGDATTPA